MISPRSTRLTPQGYSKQSSSRKRNWCDSGSSLTREDGSRWECKKRIRLKSSNDRCDLIDPIGFMSSVMTSVGFSRNWVYRHWHKSSILPVERNKTIGHRFKLLYISCYLDTVVRYEILQQLDFGIWKKTKGLPKMKSTTTNDSLCLLFFQFSFSVNTDVWIVVYVNMTGKGVYWGYADVRSRRQGPSDFCQGLINCLCDTSGKWRRDQKTTQSRPLQCDVTEKGSE